ncbi:MAG: hypothetical protein IJS28_10580 [Synergistaceae bacterium]|nr:hypothetical protein [Synergistaceae bacterium]
MAAITESKKVSVAMKLNNGTTATGAVKTASVNLGSLNKAAFDADKALNIVNALAPCFDRMLHIVEKTEVSQLSEE